MILVFDILYYKILVILLMYTANATLNTYSELY